jgi:predicted alpha/beta-hydrolase family hydrolase
MASLLRVAFGLLLCLPLAARAADGDAVKTDVATVSARAGVVQRFLLLTPPGPVTARVILFAGGDGHIGIGEDGQLARGGNFLVRTRAAWARQGFLVAVVDTPSDRDGMDAFRDSDEHAADIAAVAEFMRQRSPAPLWLVGTSRGTTSAAAVGIRLADRVAGLVLTSSIMQGRGRVGALDLARFAHPVLLIHHRADSCRVTPPSGVDALLRGFSAAPVRAGLLEEGGVSRGDACEAFAYHGYNGIEERVVQDAADWIRAPRALP